MKNTVTTLMMISLFGVTAAVGCHQQAPKVNKIFIETTTNGIITASLGNKKAANNISSIENFMSVRLDYPEFNEDLYAELSGGSNESYREVSKRYHSEKNHAFAEELGVSSDSVFISDYTPFIFYDYKDLAMGDVYSEAEEIEDSKHVKSIHLFQQDTYEAHTEDIDAEILTGIMENDTGGSVGGGADQRVTKYDNFPSGTLLTGNGIKIGILDNGTMNVNHQNFRTGDVTIVYDNTTTGNVQDHPMYIATIIGGIYGAASNAKMYYVDVNSDSNFNGLERLINVGVDIINMSVYSDSALSGGYLTNIEGYLDYLYQSTHVTMVGITGNTLETSTTTGGYVSLPALAANVIGVGSVDTQGYPSSFSSYRIENDVVCKPNLVAIGESRSVTNFGYFNGTSLSAPAVTAACALLYEKVGVLDMPKTLAALTATANKDFVHYEPDTWPAVTLTNNQVAGLGMYERTGAGALNIRKLVETTYSFAGTLTASDAYTTLKSYVCVPAGKTLTVSIAWERPCKRTRVIIPWSYKYTTGALPNYNCYLFNPATGALLAYSYNASGNNEMVRVTASSTAPTYVVIKMKPISNFRAADANCLNYAYSIA